MDGRGEKKSYTRGFRKLHITKAQEGTQKKSEMGCQLSKSPVSSPTEKQEGTQKKGEMGCQLSKSPVSSSTERPALPAKKQVGRRSSVFSSGFFNRQLATTTAGPAAVLTEELHNHDSDGHSGASGGKEVGCDSHHFEINQMKMERCHRRSDDFDEGTAVILYPSSLNDAIDNKILELWKKFIRGECDKWKEIVKQQEQELKEQEEQKKADQEVESAKHPRCPVTFGQGGSKDDADDSNKKNCCISSQFGSQQQQRKPKSPGVYWSDAFKNNMFQNISSTYPLLAESLASRPLKQSARIMCGIMQICLSSIITEATIKQNNNNNKQKRQSWLQTQEEVMDQYAIIKKVIEEDRLKRIVQHHIKWNISDAAYITVENSMIDAMKSCLGSDFLPEYEVRLRYKYAIIKNTIQHEQDIFMKANPVLAQSLIDEGQKEVNAILLRKKEEQKKHQNGGEIVDDAKAQEKGERLSIRNYSMQDLPDEYNPVPDY